jgi:hypothetical protein
MTKAAQRSEKVESKLQTIARKAVNQNNDLPPIENHLDSGIKVTIV